MKEHRKHPSSIGYATDGNQVKLDRHGNVLVSLREKEKRKTLVREREAFKSDERGRERLKALDKDREKERLRKEREEERIRLLEATRERGRRKAKKIEKEKQRHQKLERDRINRVKRLHEVSKDRTPIRSPIRSPKSTSSRSQGEIRARTPSESPPRSRLRSIVRSLPKSPVNSPNKVPLDADKDDQELFKPIPSSSSFRLTGSPGIGSTNDNSESKSEPPIIPTEDMSPISNNSSLGDIDEIESNHTPEEPLFEEDNSKGPIKSEDIVSDENFSDWSEDEDELLNKPLDKNSPELLEGTSETEIQTDTSLPKDVEMAVISSKQSTVDIIPVESQDACSSLQDDALESISDDECDAIIDGEGQETTNSNDEVSQRTPSQESLDALEIDWASLIQQPKPTPPDSGINSARKRMSPSAILSRIGFSQHYSGPQLTKKIEDYCKEDMKEKFTPFHHPVASLHCFFREQIAMRESLFESTAFFANALSARKDLDIRKILAQTCIDFSSLT